MHRKEGGPPQKTPVRKAKRLAKSKGSPAQDIRKWASRKPDRSCDRSRDQS